MVSPKSVGAHQAGEATLKTAQFKDPVGSS